MDIFSKPPRLKAEEFIVDPDGWASQYVVAQIKKTDRAKDWPIVDGLGQRLWAADLSTGLLHINDPARLQAAWSAADEPTRQAMAIRRPLLGRLSATTNEGQIERLLLLERLVWEWVNDERHRRYTRAWKDFFRRWWKEAEWSWPTSEPFRMQHQRAVQAVHQHQLPANPLADTAREDLLSAVLRRLGDMEFPQSEVARVVYESGIQHMTDSPASYHNMNPPVVPFLKAAPAHWDETRFLEGYPGKYICIARRNGQDWYIAGISSENERQVNIDLGFLSPGTYQVEFYHDKQQVSQDMALDTRTLTAPGTLKATTLKSGGFVCRVAGSYVERK